MHRDAQGLFQAVSEGLGRKKGYQGTLRAVGIYRVGFSQIFERMGLP